MKIENREAMGTMLRNRRKALGFTMKEMAEAVGVSPLTIMRLELGRVGYMRESTAKALEVPVKVVNRLVTQTVPTAVMRDGTTRPMAELRGYTTQIVVSGDKGVSQAETKPVESPAKPLKQAAKRVKQTKQVVIPMDQLSLRKRLFLWLAGVKQN